jgi:hypothetical protein
MNLHYAAGLFDGEGYVYIFKKEKGTTVCYVISTGITMCHYPTVKAFYDQFGGHLNGHRADLRNSKHRTGFMWGAANQQAAKFLRKIRPYVLIKADEIDLALALQDHIDLHLSGSNLPRDERLAYREDLFQRCKELKKRTYPPLLKKNPVGAPRGRPTKVLSLGN